MEEKMTANKPHFLKRTLLSYRKIPDKKPYIEFFAALLSIPVLLTVILLNLNSLTGTKDKETKTTAPAEKIFITVPGGGTSVPTLSEKECTPEIGPFEIKSPEEREVVTDNPVFVDIAYHQGKFCSVVWSYRINGGKWSNYDDKSIALYNLPSGNIKLDLRVKSIVSSDTDSLTRNFIYQSAEPTPIGSSSAN